MSHEPYTPFPVFQFDPDDGEIPGVTGALFGAQPRNFANPHGRLEQRCYRCGTETGLVYTNCTNDDFEYCEACGGFTLHYIRPETR